LDRFLKHRNERTAFRLADAVVFDSDATQLRVTRDYGLKPDRFETIHGGIDRNGFSPPTPQQRQDARRRLGIAHSDVVSTWTGRLSPEKNIDLLLKALACSRRPPNRVLIVGDGPARGELEKLSHELSLGGVVSYMGAQTDVRPFLHAADIFVFPSRGESFGGALVEAMACGLPCIALRPDGEAIRNANLEIIAHEKSGLLVDRAEPAALAAAIERLSADRELRTTLGNSARRATLPFTWSAASARLNMLLNEIVAGDSRRESLLDAPPLAPLQTARV
jgi:glycosyltransferase involved in cell wall biosynthesis